MSVLLNKFAVLLVKTGSIYDQTGNGELLCQVSPGYFASDAWIISDEAFRSISGRSFGVVTGDNNGEYKVDKSDVRRVSVVDIKLMLPKCNPEFILSSLNIIQNEHEQILQYAQSYWPRINK
jgi:hypothetical protein